MELHQYFLNRQMQTALYALKRQYGGPIVIYRLLSSEVNLETGEAEVKTFAIRVKRAIVLPVRLAREVVRNISLISADKLIVQGGGYDTGRKVFVIDRRDARSLVLTLDDWLVYGGHKFQFEKVDELEFDSGWIITAKVLLGEIDRETELQQTVEATDSAEIESEASAEV